MATYFPHIGIILEVELVFHSTLDHYELITLGEILAINVVGHYQSLGACVGRSECRSPILVEDLIWECTYYVAFDPFSGLELTSFQCKSLGLVFTA